MSWFFGKKKHHRESPNSPEDEGYVVVGQIQHESDFNDKSSNIYPSLNNLTLYPPIQTSFSKQSSQENGTSEINNIPFKFCKKLERSMNEDSVIDKLRLDEISSFFKKIKVTDYNYEFNLERSVINEMNSQA